jgi:ribosomal protein S18 acetylase RimI-like enzyme
VSELLNIRPATLADAARLAKLSEQTFRDTFAGDNAPGDMEAYVRDAFSTHRVRNELTQDANAFLLAFLDSEERPVGYAKLRTGTTEPCVSDARPVELHRIYVHQNAIGRGVGAALMRASLETARSAGHQTMWLGVWSENTRAISFYERWEFRTVGDHVFQLGSDEQTDLVMERPVPPP